MRPISNEQLQTLNTLELNAAVDDVRLVSDPGELVTFIRALSPAARKDLQVAGELSNTVLGDVSSLLVLFRDGQTVDIERKSDAAIVRCAGSFHFDALVELVCDQGIPGLELLSGIPGTVGAGIVQNIAAYGQRLSDRFVSAEALDLDTGEIVHLDLEAMNFSYRSSVLKEFITYTPRYVILEAVLRLPLDAFDPLTYEDIRRIHVERQRDPLDVQARRNTVLEARRRKGMVVGDENWIPSAGSFFVSPRVPTERALQIAERVRGTQFAQNFLSWYKPDAKDTRCPAALVMRAAGFLNGDQWGPVGLSPHHILALCRYLPARAGHVAGLANVIRARVMEQLGITLDTEVRYLGAMDVPPVGTFLEHYPLRAGEGEPTWVIGMSQEA
jgi:UDP-N-acetylmuramate dehydrogenase